MAQNDPRERVRHLELDQDLLDRRVRERTAALDELNAALQREITARQRAEEELRWVLESLDFGSDEKGFETTLRVSLEQLCHATGWDLAVVWVPDGQSGFLINRYHYCRDADVRTRFAGFSDSLLVALGVGIPGSVWQEGQARWFARLIDLPLGQYPLAEKALGAGMQSALAAPILAGDETYGVVVLLSSKECPQDDRTLAMTANVARYLGFIFHRRETESELRHNEQLLRAIIDNSTRVIYVKDCQGRYLNVNDQFQKLFRVALEDLKGKTDLDLFSEAIAQRFRANDRKVLDAGLPMDFEEVVPQDDGEHCYLSNKFPMFESGGQAFAVCGISTDITEQKRQEQMLRTARDTLWEEVQKYTAELVDTNRALLMTNAQKEKILEELRSEKDFSASLLDTALAIVLLLDEAGRVVYYNPYLEQLSGYPLADAKGKDWFETFLPPRDRSRIRQLFEHALGDKSVAGNINTVLTKDGREREIEWSAKLLRSQDGRILGLLCSGIDISERKQAERWFNNLLATTQDGVVSISRDGRVQLFNRAAEEIFGFRREEIVGQSVNRLMPDSWASQHDDLIRRYEHGGEAGAVGQIRRLTAKRKSGELFPIEISVTEVETEGDVQYGALIRDISENVALQERLVENERLAAIGGTAAKIGHEIANPLNGIYLTLQLVEQRLAKQPSSEGRLVADVARIKKEVARLNQLVQEFRMLSRQARYDFRPTNIGELIAELADLQEPLCLSHGIRLSRDLPEDLPRLEMDSDRMKQALLNLIKNAMEAMTDGGELSVGCYSDASGVTVTVSDTGSGIASDKDIFTPFYTTKKDGTGLGLIIVRQIVAAHHGTIGYESDLGKGTTFRIQLPLFAPGSVVHS